MYNHVCVQKINFRHIRVRPFNININKLLAYMYTCKKKISRLIYFHRERAGTFVQYKKKKQLIIVRSTQ
jgi:hypothetical protein